MTRTLRGASVGATFALLLSLALAACGDATNGATPGEDGGATSAGGPNALGGGGDAGEALPTAGGTDGAGSADGTVYAIQVESFEPGPGAGFHQDLLPDVVLGPPQGKGPEAGSLDVLSLGAGGSIVLSFGNHAIVDGPGADFVVFENAFWPGGDPSAVFAELGEVSVSQDGDTWYTFACDESGDGQGHFSGCAGVTPTLVYDSEAEGPLNPAQTGGDSFDLSTVGLSSARFVRIVDLETLPPAGNTTGFDLDAVGLIHAR